MIIMRLVIILLSMIFLFMPDDEPRGRAWGTELVAGAAHKTHLTRIHYLFSHLSFLCYTVVVAEAGYGLRRDDSRDLLIR